MAKPDIVNAEEWETARTDLLKAEKELTRAQDALAARRRRMPMVKFSTDYTFDTPTGPKSLLDLFDGRKQLAVYQFMDNGPDQFCPGCTAFTDNIPEHALKLLASGGLTWVNVSNMPLAQIEAYKAKRGWSIPFVSSQDTTFALDHGAGKPGAAFMLSFFLRDGDDVYLTYSTTRRGVDFGFAYKILDMSIYGRQEEWEDSPSGWPQHPTYGPRPE